MNELLERLIAQKQFAWQSPLLKEIDQRLKDADYRLGQALRVARQYKAQLERCEALFRRQ